MKLIKNPIFLGLALIFLVWLFNHLYYKQLQERYDEALEEHERLLETDSLNQITLDSLENIFEELSKEKNELLNNIESIDTITMNYTWGREEIYIFKYQKPINHYESKIIDTNYIDYDI